MNANTLTKSYEHLTAEERFRLILAASGRGDEGERERLGAVSPRITLSMPDHAPYGHAFSELAHLFYIELLEETARYNDAWERADDDSAVDGLDAPDADNGTDAAAGPGDARKRPTWQRALDLALAAGFMLKTKADGWKLFCERLNVPPFLLWKGYPGFDRLQDALDLAQQAAFTAEGFRLWWNRLRQKGEPEATAVGLTPEAIADETRRTFQVRVQWWGG